jgi:NAD(P)-dependent dehydrogenase (short-subunit alcohol dehydrogenase family)
MRIAIVTGGSKGIGASVMDLFAQNYIIPYDFSRSNGIDITDESVVNSEVEDIFNKHGKIDILVNNAGVATTTDILDMSLDEWNNTLNVNLNGMFICTKAVLKYMKPQKHGKIVNVSSIAGTNKSKVASVAYTTSKHGVVGFTKQLAYYYAKHNINVNCVAPSQTLTEMLTSNLSNEEIESLADQVPNKRLLNPMEVAKSVLFLCKEESSYINGETININGGQ